MAESKLHRSLGSGNVIAAVFETIEQRKRQMSPNSYVATLLRSGRDGLCCKLAEECGEVIKAAREQKAEQLTQETCDLLFHAMVLLAARGVSFADIEAEFARRHGISGLDEKAARKK